VERAVIRVKQQITKSPENSKFYEILGQTYMGQSRYPEAEAAFRKAISLNKNQITAYALLGQLFFRQNSQDKAIQEFERLLKLEPHWIQAHALLGSVYEAKSKLEKAKFHYREALKIQPDFAVAANNLAWILSETDEDIDEALSLAQVAKQKMPDLPNISDTLGWIYYKKKIYGLAILHLKDSVSRNPESPAYHYHLGMAYLKNGEPEKAKASLSKSISLGRDFSNAGDARKALREID
jgi:tetratricopeptide (TPR) repeat protein